MFATLATKVILSTLVAATPAPEWGAFRGTDGTGISAGGVLPEALDPEGNLAWKVATPKGFSSPILFGGAVVLTAHEGKTLQTLCLDRATGEVRWRREAPEENTSKYRGPNSPVSSTPATDGERVYVLYPTYGMVAYDAEGEEVWRRPMGPFNVPHTLSSSPVVAGGRILVLCDQDSDSFLAALDAASGEIAWKSARPGSLHGYTSPVVCTAPDGERQVLVSGSFELTAYSLDSGAKSWWADGMSWSGITLPVIDGERAYVHSAMPPMTEFGAPAISGTFADNLKIKDADGDGKISRKEWPHETMQQLWFLYDLDNDELIGEEEWKYALRRDSAGGGLFSVQLGGQGNITESHVKWNCSDRRSLPGFASPLVLDGVLYTIAGGGVFSSIDLASGEVVHRARVGEPDEYYASPVAAEDRILVASSSGQLSVIESGREWKVLSTHNLGEELWATPAVGDGQVIVRTQEALYCFEAAL